MRAKKEKEKVKDSVKSVKSMKTSSLRCVVAGCGRWQSTRCLTLKCHDCENHSKLSGFFHDDGDLHLHHPAKPGFLWPPHEEEDGEVLDEHHLIIIIIIY